MIKFSDRLKKARRHAGGVTQQELADYLGVVVGTVGNWETDRNMPDDTTLRKIAERLKVSDEFITGKIDELQDKASSRAGADFRYLSRETLVRSIQDCSKQLDKVQEHEMKYVVGNLAALVMELENKILGVRPVSSAPPSAAQELGRRAAGED